MMNFLQRGPKKIKGVLVEEHSGYSVTLPKGWFAYDLQHSYLIGSTNQYGSIVFSIENWLTMNPDQRANILMDEELREMDYNKEKRFSFSVGSIIEGQKLRIWATSTSKFYISFVYVHRRKDLFHLEDEKVLEIIHSLKTD